MTHPADAPAAAATQPRCNTAYFTRRTCCPACGSTAMRPVYACPLDADPAASFIRSHYAAQGVVDWSRLEGTDYALAECGTCTLLFQVTVPNERLLPIIYNEMIEPARLAALETQRLTLANFFDIAGELAHLIRLTGKHPSQVSFLDFGFGHGRWARVARALGATVYVTEFGEDKHEAAAAIGVTVLEDSEVGSRRFDIVHTEQVFEHLVDPAEQFARLASVTGSLLKIAVPRHKDAAALLARTGLPLVSPFAASPDSRGWNWNDRTYVAVQPLEHLNVYTRRAMEVLAERNRMRIIADIRKGSVNVATSGVASAMRGLARTAMGLAKSAFGPRRGYYLFAPVEQADRT